MHQKLRLMCRLISRTYRASAEIFISISQRYPTNAPIQSPHQTAAQPGTMVQNLPWELAACHGVRYAPIVGRQPTCHITSAALTRCRTAGPRCDLWTAQEVTVLNASLYQLVTSAAAAAAAGTEEESIPHRSKGKRSASCLFGLMGIGGA